MPSTASGPTRRPTCTLPRAPRALPRHARGAEVRAQPRPHAAAQARRMAQPHGGARRSRRRRAEAAGRALLALWTSVHGLASLAVIGHLPLDDQLTLEAALDAVLRTAMLGAGADPRCSRPSTRSPAACPGSRSSCARPPHLTLLDLSPDELLSTTRSVRKRLDFERPVERELLDECLALAQQAPNASNSEPWRFVVVTEDATRQSSPSATARAGRPTARRSTSSARGDRLAGARFGAVPRRPLPRGARDGAAVPRAARRHLARSRRASTARSSRPPGASSSPRAREGSARAGRRSTWGASATPPRSSASRSSASSRSR